MIKLEIWNLYRTDNNTFEIEGVIRPADELGDIKKLKGKRVKDVSFEGHKYVISLAEEEEDEQDEAK